MGGGGGGDGGGEGGGGRLLCSGTLGPTSALLASGTSMYVKSVFHGVIPNICCKHSIWHGSLIVCSDNGFIHNCSDYPW